MPHFQYMLSARRAVWALAVVLCVWAGGAMAGERLSRDKLVDSPRFKEIEKRVLEEDIPWWVQDSPDKLAEYITRDMDKDEEKAWALYRWIGHNITYDWDAFLGNSSQWYTPSQILDRKKGVCSDYSILFTAMGRTAGLEVQYIEGNAKGYSYFQGTDVPGKSNHAWNVIKIGEEWYPIDTTWGAGYAPGETDHRGHRNAFEATYFLTPPEELIFNHRPESPRWQLLENAVTMQTYLNMPDVTPRFFKLGINLDNVRKREVEVGQTFTLKLEAPEDLGMMANLKKKTESGSTQLKVNRNGKQVSIPLEFPAPGTYVVEIFAGRGGLYHGVGSFYLLAQFEPGKTPAPKAEQPKAPKAVEPKGKKKGAAGAKAKSAKKEKK